MNREEFEEFSNDPERELAILLEILPDFFPYPAEAAAIPEDEETRGWILDQEITAFHVVPLLLEKLGKCDEPCNSLYCCQLLNVSVGTTYADIVKKISKAPQYELRDLLCKLCLENVKRSREILSAIKSNPATDGDMP